MRLEDLVYPSSLPSPKRTKRKINKLTIGLLVVALVSVGVIGVLAAHYLSIYSSGTVEGGAVLVADVQSIEWGAVQRGSQVSKDVLLKNTGDGDTDHLIINVDWNDPQLAGITLTHNLTGVVIPAQEQVVGTFTLTVAPDAELGHFSFNIIIDD